MEISSNCLYLIKYFESFKSKAYICPAGYKTIGYGHVIKPGENLNEISKEQALDILKHDIYLAQNAVKRRINIQLDTYQEDALVSFVFNVGFAAFERSTLRQVINRGEHINVPYELQRWCKIKGKVSKGLLNRRKIESEIYLNKLIFYK